MKISPTYTKLSDCVPNIFCPFYLWPWEWTWKYHQRVQTWWLLWPSGSKKLGPVSLRPWNWNRDMNKLLSVYPAQKCAIITKYLDTRLQSLNRHNNLKTAILKEIYNSICACHDFNMFRPSTQIKTFNSCVYIKDINT